MDEMNAIVGACRPYINQNHNDDCGPYLIDLTDSNSFNVGRSVQKLPVNASCTYRAYSTCGYPEVYFRVHNESYRGDFDVAWATNDGMTVDKDIDGFNRTWAPDWSGSQPSKLATEFYNLGEASRTDRNAVRISDDQWNSCKGIARNLWVTITRTKDSSLAQGERTARSLEGLQQYNPGGVKYPDFDVSFQNKQGPSGAVSMVATFAIALFSALAVLAF